MNGLMEPFPFLGAFCILFKERIASEYYLLGLIRCVSLIEERTFLSVQERAFLSGLDRTFLSGQDRTFFTLRLSSYTLVLP